MSKGFKVVPQIPDDEDEDIKDNDLELLQQKYTKIRATINEKKEKEQKELEKQKNDENKKQKSVLLYELPDATQRVPPKLQYTYPIDPDWKYNPTLGDLEKRKIILTHKNMDDITETLWVAKNDVQSIRKVFISLKVKRISAIDNIKESFRMRFHIYLNWIMTEKEYRSWYVYHINNNPFDWEPTWKPSLEFMNSVEIHSKKYQLYPEHGKYRIETFLDFYNQKYEKINVDQFDSQKCKFIRCKLLCDVTFAEELELDSFPFDIQDLSCIIRGNFMTNQQYIFLPEFRDKNFGSIDSRFSVLDEWELTTALLEFGSDYSSKVNKFTYPMIVLRLKVKRKWKLMVINIMLVLAGITGLSLTAFFLDADQLGERLNLLITLILTSIAFSIVIADKLPNGLSYLTYIDKYILSSYLYLLLIMVQSVSLPYGGESYDDISYYIFIIYYVFNQLIFIFYAYYIRKYNEECKLFYSSDEINDKVSITRPSLLFDNTKSVRTGKRNRLLSYMAQIKPIIHDDDEDDEYDEEQKNANTNKNTKEYRKHIKYIEKQNTKSAILQQRYKETQYLYRAKSMTIKNRHELQQSIILSSDL